MEMRWTTRKRTTGGYDFFCAGTDPPSAWARTAKDRDQATYVFQVIVLKHVESWWSNQLDGVTIIFTGTASSLLVNELILFDILHTRRRSIHVSNFFLTFWLFFQIRFILHFQNLFHYHHLCSLCKKKKLLKVKPTQNKSRNDCKPNSKWKKFTSS